MVYIYNQIMLGQECISEHHLVLAVISGKPALIVLVGLPSHLLQKLTTRHVQSLFVVIEIELKCVVI